MMIMMKVMIRNNKDNNDDDDGDDCDDEPHVQENTTQEPTNSPLLPERGSWSCRR